MSTASPAVEARASFGERREVPSDAPEPFVFGAAAPGPAFDASAGNGATRRAPRCSPRKTASAAKAPAQPPAPEPFVFKGADEPLRTPQTRRTAGKTRAATPQSAEGMAWSPSETASSVKVASDFQERLNLEQQQQQQQPQFKFQAAQEGLRPPRRSGKPTPRRSAKPAAATDATENSGNEQPQQQQPFVFGAAAQQPQQQQPPPQQPAPFVFGAATSAAPPRATFIGLEELLKTGAPGAPMRRRRQHRSGVRAPTRATTAAPVAPAVSAASAAPPPPPPPPPAQSATAVADRARVRGNELFRSQKYDDAFKLYTEAVNALMSCEGVGTQIALLLSNRAAASLALCRPLQALQDCRMGLVHAPDHMKCALRIVTCLQRMGEFEKARAAAAEARRLVRPGDAASLQQVEAKVAEIDQSESILLDCLRGLGHDVPARGAEPPKRLSLAEAVRIMDKQGAQFPHCDVYFAARANALLRLGQLDEAASTVARPPHGDTSEAQMTGTPWRMWLRAQLAFHRGQAAEALELLGAVRGLQNAEGLEATIIPLPTAAEVDAIVEALKASEKLKGEGNVAIGAKKYAAALEAYNAAFSAAPLSPALAGVLCCNRAAAHQGLGNVALAIADCCRAKALAPGYAKAHSRLAALLTEVGMHSAAVDELNAALAAPKLTSAVRLEYQRRLKAAKEAAAPRRTFYGGVVEAPPPNHYKLLGLERSCPGDQVRKVYKKMALQLHPDKVSVRFAASLGPGAELAESAARTKAALEEGATWLFKCLGEAHDTLSDAQKRRELDAALAAAEASAGGGGGVRTSSHHHHHHRPGYHYGGGGGGGGFSGFSGYGGGGNGHYYRPYEQHGFGGSGGGRSAYGGSSFYRHYW